MMERDIKACPRTIISRKSRGTRRSRCSSPTHRRRYEHTMTSCIRATTLLAIGNPGRDPVQSCKRLPTASLSRILDTEYDARHTQISSSSKPRDCVFGVRHMPHGTSICHAYVLCPTKEGRDSYPAKAASEVSWSFTSSEPKNSDKS